MTFFAQTGNIQDYVAVNVALAVVAAIGYFVGLRARRKPTVQHSGKLQQELARAAQIAKELHQIAGRIRQDVAAHQTNISQFRTRVRHLQTQADEDGWQSLSAEAETLLVPTMKLATDLSQAYDQLRRQSLLLMNFAGSRTDPDTGIHNRRAMEEQLEVLLSLHEQNRSRFSLALFSIECSDHGVDEGDQLGKFAEVLENCARDTDMVARYSPDEFVVLMPQTSLAGATIFSERLLRRVMEDLEVVLAGGIVEVQEDDTMDKLLSRADSALYSARTNGYSCLYRHNGETIRPHDNERDLAATTGVVAVGENSSASDES